MNETYPEGTTGSVSLLGLNSKPKKKKGETPGLLQSQLNSAQDQKQQQGALASLAQNQGSLGTMNTGANNEAEQLKKKRKIGA